MNKKKYGYTINKIDHNKYILNYIIYDKPLTCKEFLDKLRTTQCSPPDYKLIYTINKSIKDLPFKAIYFESPPINKDTLNKPFFWVAVNAYFPYQKADPLKFMEYFDTDRKVASFKDLSGTILLVSPRPDTHYEKFLHLKQYIKYGSTESKNIFWNTIANDAYYLISLGNTIYLKTHGHGVPYVHFRIQLTPKYYMTHQLKTVKDSYKLYKHYLT
jgi:hypothetical protein